MSAAIAPGIPQNRPSWRLQQFRTVAAMVDAIVGAVAVAVVQGIAQRGQAALVVSGGSTPKRFFPELAGLELAWDKVAITLADERWVPPTDALSNQRLVQELLLQSYAAAARFIPLQAEAATPRASAALATAALDSLPRPYDLTLLGMGDDGHFASLFPNTPELADGLAAGNTARVIAVSAPTTATPAVPRLSLPLAELLASRRVLLVLQGAGKLTTFNAALAANDASRYPVCALLNSTGTPIDVFWAP